MESRLNPRFLTAFALAAMVGMTACDDDDDGITDPNGDPEPSGVELLIDDQSVATETNGTWQGSIPAIEVGQTVVLDVVVLDQDGDPITTGVSVQAMFADGADEDVVSIANTTNTVSLTGTSEGETSIVFQVLEGTATAHETEAIAVTVGGADTEPAGAQLIDRDSEEVITETDGEGEDMTWTEDLPDIAVGETLELDVVFVNAAGQPIVLGEDETVAAGFPEGADEDAVGIENPGDHVILTGAEAGETTVEFTRMQGETEQFTTQPIAVTVVADG